MENLIHKFIEQNIKGVDTYKHNGSTWLIFTDDRKWVIELTEDKTLWYNYNFFKSIFEFFSMDVVESQRYITKWVEDGIINRVKGTFETEFMPKLMIEDAIQNGVKETNHVDVMKFFNNKMEDTLQYGVKETNSTNFPNGECGYIREILRNGIKEVQPLPAQEGNRDWGNYYHGKEDRTKPFNEYLDDAIRFGVKETKTPGDGDIVSTVEWMKENNSNSYTKMIEDVIQSGKLNS
jgi:hypothetical protein